MMQGHRLKSRNILIKIQQGYKKHYINLELHVFRKMKLLFRQGLSSFQFHIISCPL